MLIAHRFLQAGCKFSFFSMVFMAWRWMVPNDDNYDPIIVDGRAVATGYCGKAGKP